MRLVGEGENAGKEGWRGRRRGIFIFLTHCLCLISSFLLCNSWFLITLLSPLIRARGVSLTVPHSVILSPLPLLKIKDTFITLHCLVMVSQGRSRSNNNSLISVYHSLPNRPKIFPKLTKDTLFLFYPPLLYCSFHQSPRSASSLSATACP